MLATVAPRKPSENIFAKDPIEIIEDFLMSSCSDASNSKEGVFIKNI